MNARHWAKVAQWLGELGRGGGAAAVAFYITWAILHILHILHVTVYKHSVVTRTCKNRFLYHNPTIPLSRILNPSSAVLSRIHSARFRAISRSFAHFNANSPFQETLSPSMSHDDHNPEHSAAWSDNTQYTCGYWTHCSASVLYDIHHLTFQLANGWSRYATSVLLCLPHFLQSSVQIACIRRWCTKLIRKALYYWADTSTGVWTFCNVQTTPAKSGQTRFMSKDINRNPPPPTPPQPPPPPPPPREGEPAGTFEWAYHRRSLAQIESCCCKYLSIQSTSLRPQISLCSCKRAVHCRDTLLLHLQRWEIVLQPQESALQWQNCHVTDFAAHIHAATSFAASKTRQSCCWIKFILSLQKLFPLPCSSAKALSLQSTRL